MCAVLLQNAFDAAWLAWRAGIPERIGYARDARGPLLTRAIAVPRAGEIPDTRVALLSGIAAPRRMDECFSGDRADSIAHRRRSRSPKPNLLCVRAGAGENAWRCAIAPGASYGAAKCWPPERFAPLADRLISECGADVIFFGTPGEREIIGANLSLR